MGMLPKEIQPYADRNDLQIFGSLVPAREVGGDIYDFFLRDEKLFFCIGDVSGKGVPSAIVMAEIHSQFRMASVHETNPAHIMQTLNTASCEGNEKNIFVTFFIGVLDLPTGRLRYCNAGHEYLTFSRRMATSRSLPCPWYRIFPSACSTTSNSSRKRQSWIKTPRSSSTPMD